MTLEVHAQSQTQKRTLQFKETPKCGVVQHFTMFYMHCVCVFVTGWKNVVARWQNQSSRGLPHLRSNTHRPSATLRLRHVCVKSVAVSPEL